MSSEVEIVEIEPPCAGCDEPIRRGDRVELNRIGMLWHLRCVGRWAPWARDIRDGIRRAETA